MDKWQDEMVPVAQPYVEIMRDGELLAVVGFAKGSEIVRVVSYHSPCSKSRMIPLVTILAHSPSGWFGVRSWTIDLKNISEVPG